MDLSDTGYITVASTGYITTRKDSVDTGLGILTKASPSLLLLLLFICLCLCLCLCLLVNVKKTREDLKCFPFY